MLRLLSLCLFTVMAPVSAPALAFDQKPVIIIFKASYGAVPATHPIRQTEYASAGDACAAIGSYLESLPGATGNYTGGSAVNPGGSGMSWVCVYAGTPPGGGNQGWVEEANGCPPGHSGVGGGICTRNNDERGAPLEQPPCPCTNAPIQFASGFKVQPEVDYVDPLGLLTFKRVYRSHERVATGQFQLPVDRMGRYWTDPFQRTIKLQTSTAPTVPTMAYLMRPEGMMATFARLSPTTWAGPADTKAKLESTVDGNGNVTLWTYTGVDGTIERYDAAGHVTQIVSREGRTLTLTYSGNTASGTPFPADMPAAGLLKDVTDDFGRILQIRYDNRGRIAKVIDPAGGEYVYAYDDDTVNGVYRHNLKTVTDPNQKSREYLYGEAAHIPNASSWQNHLTGMKDENGVRYATHKYDAAGKPISSEREGVVNRSQVAYLSGPVRSTVTDALGTTYTHEFQKVHGVLMPVKESVTGPAGLQETVKAYDANRNVASKTDFNGNLTCYTHDPSSNLETRRIEGLANAGSLTSAQIASLCTSTFAAASLTAPVRSITTEWHANWRLQRRIAEPLKITTYAYNGDAGFSCAPAGASTALVCRTTVQTTTDASGSAGFSAASDGAARTANYTYNSLGQILTVDGSRTDVADVTTYAYYANDPGQGLNRGMLNTVTNALSHVTTFGNYNAQGQAQTITDANGLVTTLAYDARLRLTSRNVGGETTTYGYDNAGQLDLVTMPDGSTLNYDYDNAHRLVRITDGMGNKIEYVLDAIGNRKEEQTYDPSNTLSKLMKREFNNLNRLWKDIGGTDPASQVTTYGYDNNGNLKTRTLNGTTTSFYDALNRLTKVEDPVNSTANPTNYEYNAQDALTKVTDPKGLNTTYTYNGHGDLLTQVSPDTGTKTFTHDLAGNVVTKLDARNVTATYVYDALNRVTTITYPAVGSDPAEVVSYTYDTCTNGKGRLCSLADKTGTTTWGYDLKGRITAKSQTVGTLTQTIGYSYNAAGQLTQITTPNNNVIGYGYQNNRPVSVTVNGQTVLTNSVYEPFGPNGGWKWGNSTPTTPNLHLRVFDLDYRTTQIATDQPVSGGTPSIRWLLEWDAVSRIIKLTTSGFIYPYSYNYDSLDRLTGMDLYNPCLEPPCDPMFPLFTLGYDAVGNRSWTFGIEGTSYNYGTANHHLQSLSGAQTKTYTYDAVGNMTSDGVTTWSYGGNNRPYQVSTAGGTISFSVNALGQRVKKTSGSVTTRFVYDEQGRLLGEYDNAGNVIQETVWLNDLPVAILKPVTGGDLGGDGKADVFLFNTGTGQTYLWPMDGLTILPSEGDVRTITDLNWRPIATLDVDGDGKTDIVLRHSVTGDVYVWPMDGRNIKPTEGYLRTVVDPNWQVMASGDFDGDGKGDLVWSNVVTGDNYIWFLDGVSIKPTEGPIRQGQPNWKIVGAGDFDGDRKADLLWWNSQTADTYLWPMDGLTIKPSEGSIWTMASLNWRVAGTSDFDGDGKADILLWHNQTGETYLWPMDGRTIKPTEGPIRQITSLDWRVAGTADFDGDGKRDILLRNQVTGENYLWPMDGKTIKSTEGYLRTASAPQWQVMPSADNPGISSKSIRNAGSLAGPQRMAGQPTKGRASPPSAVTAKRMLAKSVSSSMAVYYVHPDHLGTPRAITRPSDNKVMWKWDNTEPFGNSQPNENPSGLGTFVNNNRGDGQYYDVESGTIHNGRRTLGPDIGRYLQSDPIGLRAGLNTYLHVHANPLKFTDRFGLFTPPPSGAAGGGVGGSALGTGGALGSGSRGGQNSGEGNGLEPAPERPGFSFNKLNAIALCVASPALCPFLFREKEKPDDCGNVCKLLVSMNHGPVKGGWSLTCSYLCKDGSSFTISLEPWGRENCPDVWVNL